MKAAKRAPEPASDPISMQIVRGVSPSLARDWGGITAREWAQGKSGTFPCTICREPVDVAAFPAHTQACETKRRQTRERELDHANAAVTVAIIEAEALSHQTRDAWNKVAACEEQLVKLTLPGSLDHEIAKDGVRSARKKAKRWPP